MATLDEFVNRLERINFEKLALDTIQETEKVIIALNHDQLQKGRDSLGNQLRPYASQSYAKYKRKLNPRGVTDLRLTGAFYSGWKVIATKFPTRILSTDAKAPILQKQYGIDIYGLTKNNEKHYVANDFKPRFYQKVRQGLGL